MKHNFNKKAKRADTGTYNIQLTNSEGSDQASCKVLVVDRPSPPQKPIDAYDITPETCTLSWRPPADDGGANITNYVVEKFDVESHPRCLYDSLSISDPFESRPHKKEAVYCNGKDPVLKETSRGTQIIGSGNKLSLT